MKRLKAGDKLMCICGEKSRLHTFAPTSKGSIPVESFTPFRVYVVEGNVFGGILADDNGHRRNVVRIADTTRFISVFGAEFEVVS
jgi:hypothetical protein